MLLENGVADRHGQDGIGPSATPSTTFICCCRLACWRIWSYLLFQGFNPSPLSA